VSLLKPWNFGSITGETFHLRRRSLGEAVPTGFTRV
jgi:hypothetical protein